MKSTEGATNGATVDLAVRLAALGVVAVWCVTLLMPFAAVVVWGAILAIALAPVFAWLERLCLGRAGVAATLLTVLGIALILGPVGLLLTNLASTAAALVAAAERGALVVPPPPADLAEWPWVGPPLLAYWTEASTNLQNVLERFAPQLRQLAGGLLALVASAGLTMLQFIAAMIVAGVFLPNAASVNANLGRFVDRLTPERGKAFVALAGATVRNVARGVVGVAMLQSLLLGLGFLVAGMPFPGLWTLLCLVLSIIQIGPGVVVLGTLAYAWWALDATTALVFTLWTVPVSLVDNVLRPILMAQGLPVPMLVILIGVVGGTLAHGLVGLFIGPVILALGWELLRAWVRVGEGAPAGR